MILYIGLLLATFIVMEGITWLVHKYVMHGFLWVLHKDHHDPAHPHVMERNDLFFVMFAIPAIACMYWGAKAGFDARFFIGLGISVYGMAYFFVHDVFIHQRIRLFRRTELPYFKAIRRAHKQHHKHVTREEGECFGFLWVPVKYFRMYMERS